jgi:hypothetical protein
MIRLSLIGARAGTWVRLTTGASALTGTATLGKAADSPGGRRQSTPCLLLIQLWNLSLFFLLSIHNVPDLTLVAERQVRDFLIGPRNKKNRKKRATIKNLHLPVQITSRDC